MATASERTLAAEWLAVMFIETGDALAKASGKKFSLPQPQRYVATMVAYLILAGMAAFSERLGRVATALGGLVALTIVLAPPRPTQPVGPGNEPLIVSFFGWLAEMMSNPPQTISEPVAYAKQPVKVTGVNYTTRGQSVPPAPSSTGTFGVQGRVGRARTETDRPLGPVPSRY